MPSISSSFSFSPIPRSIRRLPRRASMELIPIPPISSLISCFQAVIRLISDGFPSADQVFPQVQDSAWRSPSYTCRFDTCGRDDTQEPEARLLQHNRRPLQGLLLLPHRKRCGYCRLLRAKRDFGFLHHEPLIHCRQSELYRDSHIVAYSGRSGAGASAEAVDSDNVRAAACNSAGDGCDIMDSRHFTIIGFCIP